MKPTKSPKPNWKPVRRGNIYCSTACGNHCKWSEFREAHAKGKRLARKAGKGWTVTVWENLGWYYRVESPCRRIRVHPPTHSAIPAQGTYTAFFGEIGGIGGSWFASHEDPQQAATLVVAKAKAELAKLGALLQGL